MNVKIQQYFNIIYNTAHRVGKIDVIYFYVVLISSSNKEM